MLFNQRKRNSFFKYAITVGFIFLNSGCGVLGTANPPSATTNSVGSTGCLNNSKNLVGRYVAGEISEREWKESFDCINQSLDFFTSYVRGSTPDSYSTNDMYTLVSHFLITNRPVHEELMDGAFSLKSALFGGNSQQFTKEEINLLKNSLGRLRDITGDLIPYLALRKSTNPSLDELVEMVAAFKRAGDQLGDFISTLPVGMLSDQALSTLINELTVSLDLPTFDDLGGKVFLAKWLMFNTRKDAIEQKDWPQIFRSAMGLSGVMLAYKASVGDDLLSERHQVFTRIQKDYRFREFLWQLMLEVKPYIEESLAKHNGFTPFPIFEHVIEALPPEIMDAVPKPYLKDAIKPFLRKFLFSSTQMGVDQGVVDTFYSMIENIITDMGMLDRFYEQTGTDWESVSPITLNQTMDQYIASLSGSAQIRFKEIKKKIFSYQPLFHKQMINGEEHQTILFSNGNGYSHFQNWMVLGLERVARHIQKSYGSGQGTLVDTDVIAFFKDYTDVLFAFKMVDPTIPNFGPKRLQDMDLFTPVGNGDGEGSIQELVSYAMIIISAGDLTTRMRNEIVRNCEKNIFSTDLMGWELVPAQCFRENFNDHLEVWLNDFPRLKAYWLSRTPEEQKKAMMWLEHGARRNGFTDGEFSKFDFGAMAAVLHYTESLFMRFDFDQSEKLSKAEVGSAYPVFKKLIKKTAAKQGKNLNGDFLLKAVFTYIVKYRSMPLTNNIPNGAKLVWWLATYWLPSTQYSADRLGVFNIVCQLAAPENPQLAPALDVVCAP